MSPTIQIISNLKQSNLTDDLFNLITLVVEQRMLGESLGFRISGLG